MAQSKCWNDSLKWDLKFSQPRLWRVRLLIYNTDSEWVVPNTSEHCSAFIFERQTFQKYCLAPYKEWPTLSIRSMTFIWNSFQDCEYLSKHTEKYILTNLRCVIPVVCQINQTIRCMCISSDTTTIFARVIPPLLIFKGWFWIYFCSAYFTHHRIYSFTSNLTTCFTKKILNPKYHTSTLMLVLENNGVVALWVIVGKTVQLCTTNISVTFQQF
jgi:hypothetical protein